MSEVISLDVFNCFWQVKLADLVRAEVSLRTLPITGSPLCQTWFWNQQLIIKLLYFRPVMLADQVRAAAASGHSQDLACLLANPDPNKFAPDLVLYTFSVLSFNTVNSLTILRAWYFYTIYLQSSFIKLWKCINELESSLLSIQEPVPVLHYKAFTFCLSWPNRSHNK